MGSDLRQCCTEGVQIFENGKAERLRLVATGVKGDLPFLQEVGQLDRHFRRAPKRGAPSQVSHGVCHLCCAGMPGLPFTDVSESPAFERTMTSMAAMAPWEVPSPFTLQLPSYSLPAELYKTDVWHCWHLGHGRYFISSSIIAPAGAFSRCGRWGGSTAEGHEPPLASVLRCKEGKALHLEVHEREPLLPLIPGLARGRMAEGKYEHIAHGNLHAL